MTWVPEPWLRLAGIVWKGGDAEDRSGAAQVRHGNRAHPRLFGAFHVPDLYDHALENGAALDDVQRPAGHSEPGTTKLYDRRGYNPEKSASFFATY